jgi:DNA-binding NarL/FixJ family response regulator
MANDFRARVLVAEDEEFTLKLLCEVLEGANFQVKAVNSVVRAIEFVKLFDPHVVITDLNFGVDGLNGSDLLWFMEKEYPWVSKIVLTSHSSPALAIPNKIVLPVGVTYLVKSELKTISDLITSVESSISNLTTEFVNPVVENGRTIISSTQGEILLLLAEGYTNTAIAQKRGTSLRAAETLVHRTFTSLGIKNDEDFNPRVLAVRMWQQGKVVIK